MAALMPRLIMLAHEIRRVLPGRSIHLVYEPDEDGTIWTMYVLLAGNNLYDDLSKLYSIYYDFLPRQGPQFNRRVALAPL